MKGESVNIDLKKLLGDWEGYYRIRVGKVRIIFEIDKENKKIFVERVDHGGDVYKQGYPPVITSFSPLDRMELLVQQALQETTSSREKRER